MRAKLLIQRKRQLASAEAARAAEQLAAEGHGSHLAVWRLKNKQLTIPKQQGQTEGQEIWHGKA